MLVEVGRCDVTDVYGVSTHYSVGLVTGYASGTGSKLPPGTMKCGANLGSFRRSTSRWLAAISDFSIATKLNYSIVYKVVWIEWIPALRNRK